MSPDRHQDIAVFTWVMRRLERKDPHGERRRCRGRNRDDGRDRRDDTASVGLIRTVLLIGVAALVALSLTGCDRLFPDVEDWIASSETLARRFDARLDDLKKCVEEDNCDEALDTERDVFAMCSWVMSRGELAPEGFEEAEWHRFDTLCEGLEGVRELPRVDALIRIEGLQAETDRVSEGIRADIEPREREEVE